MKDGKFFFDRDRLYESEHAFVVEDAFPVSPGHMLVIPKREVKFVHDLYPDEWTDLWNLVKKSIRKHVYSTDYNIGVNSGTYAGQTIGQAHIHIIPRFEGDVENPRGGVRGVIPQKRDYQLNDSDN